MSDPRFLQPPMPQPGCWPDGEPIHDRTLYVLLSCGHERVSRGWRGGEGGIYCCDVCKELTTIAYVTTTDEQPRDWTMGPPGSMADAADRLARAHRALMHPIVRRLVRLLERRWRR